MTESAQDECFEFDYFDAVRVNLGPIAVFRRNPEFLRRSALYWFLILAAALFVVCFASSFQADCLWVMLGLYFWVLAILCFVFIRSKHRRIEIHFDSERVLLFGFRYPLGFWDIWAKKQVEIPFQEIIYTQRPVQGGSACKTVDVYTKQSRFSFSESIGQSAELKMVLDSICSRNPEPDRREKRRQVWIGKAVVCWLIPYVVVAGILVFGFFLLP